MVSRDDLANAGGLEYTIEYPEPLSVHKCKEKGIWPAGMPEDTIFIGTRVYKKTARELAKELGTTPRQISKLRSGRINEAKPLSWYEENNRKSGV